MNLADRLTTVKGVGAAKAAQLLSLGLTTVGDLLWWFPRQYVDCRQPALIADLRPGALVVVRAQVTNVRASRSRRGKAMVRAVLFDVSGEIEALWFNQPYLADVLKRQSEAIFIGKAARDFTTGRVTLVGAKLETATTIIPIYSVTKGLSSRFLARLVADILPQVAVEDPLSASTRERAELLELGTALQYIHQPADFGQIAAAKRRFIFAELYQIQLGIAQERRELERWSGPAVPADVELLRDFVSSLPFTLTPGQKKAIWVMAQEQSGAKTKLMHRLLNGDVGSGKTVVAAALCVLQARAGRQSVLMAPTDLLAQQHAATLGRFLAPFKIKVGLVTARQKEWKADVLIGTHALIQKSATFKKVGLVVIDEQHRFGVAQRDALWAMTGSAKRRPHLLSLTATPIPRSLALTLFGALDVLRLTDKPAGRQPIRTTVVKGDDERLWQDISATVGRGEQVYLVCPLIEEVSLEGALFDERKSVTEVFQHVQARLPQVRVGLLHGKLKEEQKDAITDSFRAGELDVLVSTTVVEVGVDVPNATLMVIENAERFGIAQLHQLRGRVGRGEQPSECLLVVRTEEPEAIERCQAVARTNDGFALAEYDLKQRGPGDLIGIAQSGYKLAFLDDVDIDLLTLAQQLATEAVQQT